jgi:hypothetical protein
MVPQATQVQVQYFQLSHQQVVVAEEDILLHFQIILQVKPELQVAEGQLEDQVLAKNGEVQAEQEILHQFLHLKEMPEVLLTVLPPWVQAVAAAAEQVAAAVMEVLQTQEDPVA